MEPQVMIAIMNHDLPTPPEGLMNMSILDQSLWRLCNKCWRRAPVLRPTITNIVDEINEESFVSSTFP